MSLLELFQLFRPHLEAIWSVFRYILQSVLYHVREAKEVIQPFVEDYLQIIQDFFRDTIQHVHEAQEAIQPLLEDYLQIIQDLFRDTIQHVHPSDFTVTSISNAFRRYTEVSNFCGPSKILEQLRGACLDYFRSIYFSPHKLFQSVKHLLFPSCLSITYLNKVLRAPVTIPFPPANILGLLAGVVTHFVIFNSGEWDRYSTHLAATLFAIECIIAIFFFGFKRWAIVLFLKVSTMYLAGILFSILIYRVFFHPLRKFPGPFFSRITSLWRRPDFKSVWEDHVRYGDIVRIGPRELSINDVEIFHQVHGPGSPCVKAPIYECTLERTLQCTREYPMLTERTTIWERALDHKYCLKGYEAIILNHCRAFIECLKESAQSPIKVTQLFRFFSYDVMGDIALGKSFDMVKTRKWHSVIRQEDFVQDFVGSFKSAPWLVAVLKKLPAVKKLRVPWLDECNKLVEERLKLGQERDDLFSSLLSYARATSLKPSSINYSIASDVDLAMSTGTDTIAYTLSALTFLLATHPEKQRLLQEEVRQVPPDSSGFTFDYLKYRASYLNGCINEALRLYPVIPGGIQRLTPPEGATFAGRSIPGNMIISTPIWTMHRDPRYFVSPNEFIPERWTTRQDLILDWDAYVPFLTGPYKCPARQFATLEIRMLVSLIVFDFDFRSQECNRIDGVNVIRRTGPEEKFFLRFPEHRVAFYHKRKPLSEEEAKEGVNKKPARFTNRQTGHMQRVGRENWRLSSLA